MSKAHRKIPALTAKDVARFWSKVRRGEPDECWDWTDTPDRGGYGRFKIGGITYRAGRVAYLLGHGVDPFPLLVCHSCDRPPCSNPAHLFAGTDKDNLQDCKAKGRLNTAAGEKHGSKTQPWSRAKGESVCGAKLTADEVIEIRRRFHDGESQQSIADSFGITREGVGRVTQGKTWKHVGGPVIICDNERQGRKGEASCRAKLRVTDVQQIRKAYAIGRGYATLAREYRVTKENIAAIVKRRTWKHVN